MDSYQPTGTMLDALANADVLLEKRDNIVKRLKPLRARYGGAGNYLGERFFKQEEAKLDVAIRAAAKDAGEKVTEPMVDARVRTHPAYTDLLLNEVKQREAWIELEEELKTLEWRLEIRKSDSYLLGREAGLSQ